MELKKDTDIERFINYYWLNLGDVNKLKLENPFVLTKKELEDPARYFMRIMMNPEFFYFTCKHLFATELAPFQIIILRELWNRPFPMLIGARGASKTMMLALYSMLKAVLCQGSKIVVCGTGLRQSRLVFEYCMKIWNSSDLLRDLILNQGRDQGPHTHVDKLEFVLGESTITFIPIGTGEKVRGLRANVLITDEFQHHNPEIFEVVLSGFTSVNPSPIDSMKYSGRIRGMKALNIPIPEGMDGQRMSNQSILSGTAYYSFNHFCEYWKKWKAIIESEGNINRLEEIFQGDVPIKFDHRDYGIMRIPMELLPDDYMDVKSVTKQRVSMHTSAFNMEYGAVFSTDSLGFFKRTLVESCVARDIQPIDVNGVKVTFNPRLKGSPNLRYIFGIDPASEKDRFTIVVIELQEGHRRIIFAWSTLRSEFKSKLKDGMEAPNDFYQYCARKIRDLMKLFPCERIIMDAQGGGYGIEEALQNKDTLQGDEIPIYQIIEEDTDKPTDDLSGLHILELAQFSRPEWVSNANHGMRKDFEEKILLFPDYDAAMLSLAQMEDESKNRAYDTMEDCINEIEELKEELASIVHTQTGIQLRDRWDTPEVKLPGNKKGRLRKDRYSALLMANMAGRTIQNTRPNNYGVFYGAKVQEGNSHKLQGKMWIGPDWFTKGGTDVPGVVLAPQTGFDYYPHHQDQRYFGV